MDSLNIDALSRVDDKIKESLKENSKNFIFNKYSAKGANGYVFFGKNKITKERVVIKYYYWDGNQEHHIEPQSIAELKSSNIIDILHASIVDDDWAMFITPFYEDGDLDDLISETKIGLHKALKFTGDILGGLNALHNRSLIHRDIKPENIFLKNNEALIGDFGSVKKIVDESSMIPASAQSIPFLPPESCERGGSYSYQGDIYQCGVVLYQLLGGYLPYNETAWLNKKEIEMLNKISDPFERSEFINKVIKNNIVSGKLIKLDSLPFWVPLSVKHIIKKSTEKDLSKRYCNTSDFIVELHKVKARACDWRIDDDYPILYSRKGNIKYRLEQDKKGGFIVMKDKNSGWRKDSSFTKKDLKSQVELLHRKESLI
jgi:serine/threonine protein kinase